jgi:hypothetical protein
MCFKYPTFIGDRNRDDSAGLKGFVKVLQVFLLKMFYHLKTDDAVELAGGAFIRDICNIEPVVISVVRFEFYVNACTTPEIVMQRDNRGSVAATDIQQRFILTRKSRELPYKIYTAVNNPVIGIRRAPQKMIILEKLFWYPFTHIPDKKCFFNLEGEKYN